MTSECICYIAPMQDILQLHGLLKQHAIIYSPPYSIYDILSPYLASHGRQVKIVITHRSRDVQIVERSITHHVVQTTIRAFQSHRLAPSSTRARPLVNTVQSSNAHSSEETQQECPICFDKIRVLDGSALPCMHSFHMRCIRPWLLENDSCPVCRHPV